MDQLSYFRSLILSAHKLLDHEEKSRASLEGKKRERKRRRRDFKGRQKIDESKGRKWSKSPVLLRLVFSLVDSREKDATVVPGTWITELGELVAKKCAEADIKSVISIKFTVQFFIQIEECSRATH